MPPKAPGETPPASAGDYFRCLVEATADGVISANGEGEIVTWNAAAKKLFGFAPDAMPCGTLTTLVPGCLDDEHDGAPVERVAHRTDGSLFPAEVGIAPMTVGDARFVVATVRDVSRRRAAEDALRASEERYRRIIETTHEGVCIADPDYRYTFVNARLAEMLGYSVRELVGMTVFELMDEAGGVAQRERMARRRDGRPESGELGLRRKDGVEIWVMFESHSIYEDGRYGGVLSLLMDISERRRMEARLRQSESQLREAQRVAHMGSWEWNLASNVVTRSAEFDRILEIGPGSDGSPAFDAIHPDDSARVRESLDQAIRDRARWSCDYRLVVRSGVRIVHARGEVVVDATGAAGRMVGTVEDVTEKREAEARMSLSGRMASLGTLALGLAHEINNPLASVTANLALIDEEIRRLAAVAPSTTFREIDEMVREASGAAERVRETVRGLKTFSRGDDEEPIPLDLRRVLDVAVDLTKSEVRSRARLVKDYGDTPVVIAGEARIGQVFINLLMNAAQACADGTSERNEVRVVTRTTADGRALVEVRDTGCGIPPEILGRIFDPFFTTKAIGAGTGLGLSVCHGIVSALGGQLTAESAGRGGSVFSVTLPPAPREPAIEPAPIASLRADPVSRASVLVVDDDVMVSTMIGRVLREHEITVATNGRDALDLLVAGRTFDVILCDLMMPVMTGMELHAQLSEKLPQLVESVIFVTGGAVTAETRAFLDRVPNECLDKPFNPRSLRAVVQRATRPRAPRA
jgi:PAS domain S-box-containing protein